MTLGNRTKQASIDTTALRDAARLKELQEMQKQLEKAIADAVGSNVLTINASVAASSETIDGEAIDSNLTGNLAALILE